MTKLDWPANWLQVVNLKGLTMTKFEWLKRYADRLQERSNASRADAFRAAQDALEANEIEVSNDNDISDVWKYCPETTADDDLAHWADDSCLDAGIVDHN